MQNIKANDCKDDPNEKRTLQAAENNHLAVALTENQRMIIAHKKFGYGSDILQTMLGCTCKLL